MTLRSPYSLKYPISSYLVSLLLSLLGSTSYDVGRWIDAIDTDFTPKVGSAAYESTITNHTEVLPVSVDIIGELPMLFSSYAFLGQLLMSVIF